MYYTNNLQVILGRKDCKEGIAAVLELMEQMEIEDIEGIVDKQGIVVAVAYLGLE